MFNPWPPSTWDHQLTNKRKVHKGRTYVLIRYRFIKPNPQGHYPSHCKWVPEEYFSPEELCTGNCEECSDICPLEVTGD